MLKIMRCPQASNHEEAKKDPWPEMIGALWQHTDSNRTRTNQGEVLSYTNPNEISTQDRLDSPETALRHCPCRRWLGIAPAFQISQATRDSLWEETLVF